MNIVLAYFKFLFLKPNDRLNNFLLTLSEGICYFVVRLVVSHLRHQQQMVFKIGPS